MMSDACPPNLNSRRQVNFHSSVVSHVPPSESADSCRLPNRAFRPMPRMSGPCINPMNHSRRFIFSLPRSSSPRNGQATVSVTGQQSFAASLVIRPVIALERDLVLVLHDEGDAQIVVAHEIDIPREAFAGVGNPERKTRIDAGFSVPAKDQPDEIGESSL